MGMVCASPLKTRAKATLLNKVLILFIQVGLIYIFNLIVGTGALTLPAAFARAGWGLSTISLMFLAFMSFLNATYVIETMACANAVYKWKRLQTIKRESVSIDK